MADFPVPVVLIDALGTWSDLLHSHWLPPAPPLTVLKAWPAAPGPALYLTGDPLGWPCPLPGVVIFLCDREAPGEAAIAAGATDYWLTEEIHERHIGRSLRLLQASPKLCPLHPDLAQVPALSSVRTLQTLVNQLPMILYSVNKDGYLTFLAGRDMTQLELSIPPLHEAPPIREWPLKSFDFLSQIDIALQGKEHHWTDNYGEFHYENYAVPLYGDQQQIIGMIGLAIDITKQHKAQQAQRISEENLRLVMDHMSEVFFVIDGVTGKALYRNQAYYRIWQEENDEGKQFDTWINTIYPEDRPKILENVNLLRHGHRGELHYEYRIQRPNGEIRWLLERITTIENTDQPGFKIVGIARDITVRKNTEAKLEESQRRLQMTANHVPVSIFYIDHQYRYQFVNATYLQWVGKTETEILGQTMEKIVPPEILKKVKPAINQGFQGIPQEYEIDFPFPDRSQHHLLAKIVPDANPTGEIQGLYGVVMDITTRYNLENDRQQQLQLNHILASLSHHFILQTQLDLPYWLAQLGQTLGIARLILLQYTSQPHCFSDVCEWTAPGEPHLYHHHLPLKLEHYPYYENVINSAQLVIDNDIKDFHKIHCPAYACDEEKTIQGIMVLPIINPSNQVWGLVIGHSSKQYPHHFSDEDRQVLQMFGEMYYSCCDRLQKQARLEAHLRLETVVAQVSQLLAKQIAPDWNYILGLLGGSIDTDWIYLTQFLNDKSLSTNIAQWSRWHQQPMSDLGYHFITQPFQWWHQQLENNQNIVINSLDDLPSNAIAEKQLLQFLNVQSVLAVPIYEQPGKLWGQIAFENQYQRGKPWSQEDAQLLRVVGEIIYRYFARVQSEQELRTSEALYASVFNHSAEKIYLLNVIDYETFEFATLNPAFQEATGILIDNAIGKNPSLVFAPETAARLLSLYQFCLRIGETIFFEENLTLPRGEQIWRTCLVPIKNNEGKVIKIQSSSRDITAEKKAELAQIQYARYQNLLASLTLQIRQFLDFDSILNTAVQRLQQTLPVDQVIFWTALPQGGGIATHEAYDEKYPSERGRVLGATEFQEQYQSFCHQGQLHINHISEGFQDIQTHIHTRLLLPIINEYSDQEKTVIQLRGIMCLQHWSPRPWGHEEIAFLRQLASHLNIALYQAELLAKEKNYSQKLIQSNRELEQFAYVASHDLQEPLQTIASYTKLLARRYQDKLDEKGDKFVHYIVDGCQRMQRQINDLLQYSRLSMRKQPFELTDLGETVQQVMESMQITLQKYGVVIALPRPLPMVWGDRSQLLQLWQNLVSNAVKYRRGLPPTVTITYETEDGESYRFAIADNGIGINPRYKDRIFEIFQRLHTQEEYPGTGIGLALCKKIVERHGGKIWLEGEEGVGSTFFFTLANQPEENA